MKYIITARKLSSKYKYGVLSILEHFEPYNPEAPAMNRPPPYWTGPPPGMNAPPPGPPGMYMMHGPPLPPNMQQQGQRQRDLVNIRTMPDQQKGTEMHF